MQPHTTGLPKSRTELGTHYMYQKKCFPKEFKVGLMVNPPLWCPELTEATNLCKIKTVNDQYYITDLSYT